MDGGCGGCGQGGWQPARQNRRLGCGEEGFFEGLPGFGFRGRYLGKSLVFRPKECKSFSISIWKIKKFYNKIKFSFCHLIHDQI
jgi:hypothetical protein